MSIILFGTNGQPFPLLFDPPPSVTGGASVRFETGAPPRPEAPGRGRGFRLDSNPANTSSCHVLRSFGMNLGVPTNDMGERFRGASILQVTAAFRFQGAYLTVGTFASAKVSVIISIFVEEFAPDGSFVRSASGPPSIITDHDVLYFAGVDSWEPRQGSGQAICMFPARPDHSYRAFVDVEGRIRAEGTAGFGGSTAVIDFISSMDGVLTRFIG